MIKTKNIMCKSTSNPTLGFTQISWLVLLPANENAYKQHSCIVGVYSTDGTLYRN